MAFLVEDGSGVEGANAYVAVAFVTTHHTDRGQTAWGDFGSQEQQAAIIRASDYVDKRFGRQFRGFRQSKRQGLEWPRLSAFDDDGFLLSGTDDLPRQLQRGVAEYALRAIICGTLSPDPISPVPKQDLTDSTGIRPDQAVTGQITRTRDKVSVLEEERWYETTNSVLANTLAAGATRIKTSLVNDFNIPEYPEADMWLEELLVPSMGMSLVRGD